MQKEFGLHELAVEDAQTGHQRPKIEEYGNSLFVVLHTVELEGKSLRAGEVAIFAGPNYVLSVRNRTKRGFADVRARCEAEPDLLRHGSGFVLYALVDSIVDRYFPVLEALETEFENLEEQIFAGGLARRNIEALYALKQKLMVLRHASGPLSEGVGKLYGGRVPQVCHGTQEYFRDVYDHLGRINQTIDGIRDGVTTAMSVSLSLHPAAGQRDDQAARLLRRAGRGADDDRRHLRHELQAHAGARLDLRLSDGDRRDDRDRRFSRLEVSASGLAVATRPDARDYPATAFASSRPRASPGARPVQRRKARLKLDASAKPRR